MHEREDSIVVEWYDEVTGQWADLGEATSVTKASQRIAGLHAADQTPQRYRIVERTATIIPDYDRDDRAGDDGSNIVTP
jgi:hypothetical protein